MKPGFYTGYIYGRMATNVRVSSVCFQTQKAAQDWADYMNESRAEKKQKHEHFVFQIPGSVE